MDRIYNRYLEQLPEGPPQAHDPPRQTHPPQPVRNSVPQPHAVRGPAPTPPGGGLGELLSGVLKSVSNEQFDAGDLLLVLIILLLILEGDDLEVIITLALMLLLGLGDP